MEHDDTMRSKKGVVVCLRDMGDGTSTLFFDDVAANQERNPSEWRTESFFTASPGFENTELDVMQITEAQLQDIGLVVVSRLLALNGRLK